MTSERINSVIIQITRIREKFTVIVINSFETFRIIITYKLNIKEETILIFWKKLNYLN